MNRRLYSLITAFGLALAAILLLGTFVSQAAPSPTSVSGVDRATEFATDSATDSATTISAMSAVSIPTILLFGFEPPLVLNDDGRTVEVNGHGTCPEGGEMFRLMVIVTQDSSGARARGTTIEQCTGDLQHWSIDAKTLGPAWRTFDPGLAQACAMAQIFRPQGGTVTGAWCADVAVELQE
jgi:hypothetical protein